MDIILIAHLLKLDSTNSFSLTIPSVGLTVAVKAFLDSVILIVGIILRLGITQSSSKCLTLPNALEICRTLLFHVTEALTPKAFRSCGNSVLTIIPCILLPFVLALELIRTGLPTVLVEALSICILHKFLKLLGDVGLHLIIFIV